MLILTPNRRLAAFSKNIFQQQQAVQGLGCWETPEIYPIESWLTQLWQNYLELQPKLYAPLLSKLQQQQLFENIILESAIASDLLRVNAAAQNVIQAWNFINQWQVGLQSLAAYADFSADTAAFNAWLQQYLVWLEQNNYYDFVSMVNFLSLNLSVVKDYLPQTICLRGFTEIVPQYAKLITALQDCGVTVINDSLLQSGAVISRAAFINIEAELTAAAQWALKHINENPQQIIGVVVPELENLRGMVGNVFESIIPKQYLNISAPYPLANYELIDSALLILQIAKSEFNFDDLSLMLRLPFISDYEEEANSLAQLDRILREQVSYKVNWNIIKKILADTTSKFSEKLINFVQQIDKLHGKHNAEYWVLQIQNLLVCWGWPGNRHRTEIDADLLSCWTEVLDDYCGLAMFLSNHTFGHAVQIIQRLLNDTPFLPAETGLTKVHVLGVLEADGIAFDQLWVCGMTRDSWPTESSPNPFIPLELQRQFDMPRSSPGRELTVAKRLTENLKRGSKNNIIFSYPLLVEDYETAPSNLIVDLPLISITSSEVVKQHQSCELEILQDNMAPELQDFVIKGGANALKLQAQCPFKANAEIRLHAKQLLQPQNILSAAQRGSLVHEVLEQFWKQCISHAQLLEWFAVGIDSKLDSIIARVLKSWRNKLPILFNDSYVILESQRLKRLTYSWLKYELERDPFIVSQLEQRIVTKVGPLHINLQIDRIDKLINGDTVIIDYKTGSINTSEWYTEPIYEPQLPLYAVYAEDTIVAIAVALLHPNEVRLIWADSQQQNWQLSLEDTALRFVAGHAEVAPYKPKVCSNCKLHGLCRIHDK